MKAKFTVTHPMVAQRRGFRFFSDAEKYARNAVKRHRGEASRIRAHDTWEGFSPSVEVAVVREASDGTIWTDLSSDGALLV